LSCLIILSCGSKNHWTSVVLSINRKEVWQAHYALDERTEKGFQTDAHGASGTSQNQI
jgi:hypothetical protein